MKCNCGKGGECNCGGMKMPKKKFDVWPSAYGSAWLTKTYKARGGKYSGTKNNKVS